MSYKFNSSNCSLVDEVSDCTVLAKLRRLKIEENLLLNNINKIKEIDEDADLPTIYSLDLKNYTTKLKSNFAEIKNMFGDVKAVTEEKLSDIDIENVKRDVIKLDDKMRIFKSHLQSELASISAKEEELIKQINDVEEKQKKCSFLKTKTRRKPFNSIVPSPVKNIINSPLKCKEVQEFQEFIMCSPNRYGGWNEYHHNVFVQIWNKYYIPSEEIEFNHTIDFPVGSYGQFQAFQKEIILKLSGSTKDDIVSHYKWYSKYLYLKQQQQNALNKWKSNRRMLSKSQHKQNNCTKDTGNSDKMKSSKFNGKNVCTKIEEIFDTAEIHDAEDIANAICDAATQNESSFYNAEINCMNTADEYKSKDMTIQKQRSFNDILKPTLQWTNRCNSSQECVKAYNSDIETIKKLRIPQWRLTFQDKINHSLT